MDLASFRCEVKQKRDQIARKRKADFVEDMNSVEDMNNIGKDESFNFSLLAVPQRLVESSQETQSDGEYDYNI